VSGRVDGKVVVVTGGARGQGAEQARLLHREGASVVIADVLRDEGAAVAADLGERARFVSHDITDEDGWESLIAATEAAFGPVTGLVHAAGIFAPSPLADTTTRAFMRTVEVNQLGSFLALRAAARAMPSGGSVVLISSTAAHAPSGLSLVPYAASKWAVRGMAHSAAIELAPIGIRVNAVAPGAIATPMITDRLTEQALVTMQTRIPLGRLGSPADVAPLVLYLISDESAYCTGSDFIVDGGMTAGSFQGHLSASL
jgi:3alpha(or 20beta)-hydroxysteroid dehydrogenase